MNNIRNKKKNIYRALKTIQVEEEKKSKNYLYNIYINEKSQSKEKDRTHIKPVFLKQKQHEIEHKNRYDQYSKEQEDNAASLANRYKSLELRKQKTQKRSDKKIMYYKSIEKSPYQNYRQIRINTSEHIGDRLISKKSSKKYHISRRVETSESSKYSHGKIPVSIGSSEHRIHQNNDKQLVKKLILKQKYERALQILERLKKKDNRDIEVYELCGSCYVNLKQFNSALSNFSKIIQIDPSVDKSVYTSAAFCCIQLTFYSESIKYLNMYLESFPSDYDTLYLKGKTYYKMKQYENAIKYLKEANHASFHKTNHLFIGDCYAKLLNYDKAIEEWRIGLKQINPKIAKYKIKIAQCFLQKGNYEQVIQICLQYLKYVESHRQEMSADQYLLECYYLLSLIYYRQGIYDLTADRLTDSMMNAEEILNHQNKYYNTKAIIILIVIQIKLRNFYDANHILQRCDQISVDSSAIFTYCNFCEAVVLLMKKKYKQALEKLEKIKHSLIQDSKENEFLTEIYKIYHLYTAYGYIQIASFQIAEKELQIQQKIGIEPIYQKSHGYNLAICKGIIAFNQNHYRLSHEFFKKSLQFADGKKESQLYAAIALTRLFFQTIDQNEKIKLLNHIRQSLNICAQFFLQINSNFAARVFYHRALFNCWQQNLSLALQDMDEAIDKSQQNYLKFFYLRGLILALCQNFKQAINDASVAISLDEADADSYLLRSRCLQIEGDGSQAFLDLQSFIALKPDDPQIHKYAGHLLFENGAFADSILAYNQGEEATWDFDVYLTRSKTHFLQGEWLSSYQDMYKAYQLKPEFKEAFFDYNMIKWMAQFFKDYKKDDPEAYQLLPHQMEERLKEIDQIYHKQEKYGKIFKKLQSFILKALCSFYQKDYHSSIKNFQQAIKLKLTSMMLQEQSEPQFDEQQAQKKIFINQMHLNLSICYLMLEDYEHAQYQIQKCDIEKESKGYEIYAQFKKQIKGEEKVKQNQNYEDIFSLKNKLSKYLPSFKVPFNFNGKITYRKMKLCIPYPKVQPPQISPKFDVKLISELTLDQIETKPEAPWIIKQANSIKFTDNMEVYSRLDLESSQVSKISRKRMKIDDQEQQMDISFDLKEKLKLDDKIEEKLNKLMKKKDKTEKKDKK